MRTTDDLEFNEVTVLARQGGQVSVWGCWKRALAAFHDPAMWEGVEAFEKHFDRLAGPTWGPSPYGFVVVDFDTRQVLSANDWSTPSSLHPILANVQWEDGPDPSLAPLQALSLRPDCWPHVRLRVARTGLKNLVGGAQDPDIQEVAMDQALGPGATAEDFMAAMRVHGGFSKLPTLGRCMILEGRFLPPGWTQDDDRGQEMPGWMLEQLCSLQARGFPAPNWSQFDEQMESSELPVNVEALDEMREEADAGDPEAQALLEMGLRYQALKKSWGAATASPPPPKPSSR